MQRIGVNPAREGFSEYKPARVTVAVLTYIPMLQGYFAERLNILKLCLDSIIQNTQMPFDLMVFDNGSCPEVRNYLRELSEQGVIQYLLECAENIGKIGAFQIMFRAAPGEIVAYCDDDVYHYPGWLAPQVEILDHFPKTGMVSGTPIRVRFNDAIQSNLDFVSANPEASIARGRFIKPEWEREFCLSTGRDVDEHLKQTADIEDLIISYQGKSAYASANHFQFVSPRQALVDALPAQWSGQLMRSMMGFDATFERMGLLRLGTLARVNRHMGNTVSDELYSFLSKGNKTNLKQQNGLRTNARIQRIVIRLPGMRRFAKWLYHRLFLLLNNPGK